MSYPRELVRFGVLEMTTSPIQFRISRITIPLIHIAHTYHPCLRISPYPKTTACFFAFHTPTIYLLLFPQTIAFPFSTSLFKPHSILRKPESVVIQFHYQNKPSKCPRHSEKLGWTIAGCTQTNTDDIVYLKSGDPEGNILREGDLEVVLFLVKGDSVTFRGYQLDKSPDIVSIWVETGENSVDLTSVGSAESTSLGEGSVLPVHVEVNEGKEKKMIFAEGKKPLHGAT